LRFAHGGRADFRGEPGKIYCLLSASDVSFSVLFKRGDFPWASRLVHGTKMAAGYWVVTAASGRWLAVEYTAEKFDPVAIVSEVGRPDVHVRDESPPLAVDEVTVSMSGKELRVVTSKWLFAATTSAYPFGKLEANRNKVLLDVSVTPRDGYDPETDEVAPHGLLGQSYDGDEVAVDGKTDAERPGESTTAAQAEGAIEGTAEDYVVADKFSTDFRFSRFGLHKAAPRDVSGLTGTKRWADGRGGAVGASDVITPRNS